jgi:putative FmdB family regulatory protein
MPIYEYRCNSCKHDFEALIRSSSDTAHCPTCGNVEVEKQVSVPAVAHSKYGRLLPSSVESSAPKLGGCGRSQCGCC